VPDLVESVKGYMSHERQTLMAVTQARSNAMRSGADSATRVAAEMALTGALGNLLMSVGRYPESKASQNFMLLQAIDLDREPYCLRATALQRDRTAIQHSSR
jgi:LemA protein